MSRPVAVALAVALGCAAPACRNDAHRAPEPERGVHDGLGRLVVIPAPPRRIVTLAPNATDTIAALGLGDRLVGVSDFCQPPPEAKEVRRVGGLLTPDLEVIRALKPDLLVGSTSGNDPGLASEAQALGIPLFILNAETVEQVLEGIGGLGVALGEQAKATALVQGLRARLDAVDRRVAGRPRPRVLYIVWGDPLVVPGAKAFLTDAIRRAGGDSVTDDAPAAHPTYSIEAAIARSPEVILTSEYNRADAEKLRKDPAWQSVPAVASGRVYVVGDELVRPGPAIVGGIEEMARRLHPETAP
ncbi:MAG TPA: cobalamin-binding protein [Candidatus Polarisedimenticolia bacterium]|jgi:iron complex transport system substrate-binding protein|nr:cobalamin-binding protein [Candidatus Polarisedimenticolia bacterium]